MGTHLPALIVAWVRFSFGLPIAIVLCTVFYFTESVSISLNQTFYISATFAALAQFLGSLFAVMLLTRRNFAVGATLIKSETAFVGILSLFILGESLSILGWMAVALGVLGVLMISIQQFDLNPKQLLKKRDSPSAILGLLAGCFFAVAATFIRRANLSLSELSSYQAASLTLVYIIVLQTLLGLLWIIFTDRTLLKSIPKHVKACAFIGVTSVLGSFGWFWAYALQQATLVKTLGHIEILIAMLMTWRFFKESIHWLEYVGIALIIISSIMVMWF